MEDFIKFRRMITPFIVELVFVVFTVLIVAAGVVELGIAALDRDGPLALVGLLTLFVGPLILRIWLELAVVFFRMNETLTDLREVAIGWRSELDRGGAPSSRRSKPLKTA
jgi:hypothetical protein